MQRRPPRDTTAKNALAKFDAAIAKKYEKQLENFSDEELRKLEELKDLFEFLDDIIPLEDDEDEPPKKGRKRSVIYPSILRVVLILRCYQAFHECSNRNNDDECRDVS